MSEEDPAAAAREQMRWPSNRGRRTIAALLSARTGDVKRALRTRTATSSPLVPVPENVPSGPDASLNARRSWSSRGESARSQPSHVGQTGRGLNRSITLTARPHCPCCPIAEVRFVSPKVLQTIPRDTDAVFVDEPVAFRPTCDYAFILAHGANSVASMAAPHYSNAASRLSTGSTVKMSALDPGSLDRVSGPNRNRWQRR